MFNFITLLVPFLAILSADLALYFQILQVPAARHRSGILFLLFDLKIKIVSLRKHLLKWLTFKSFFLLPVFTPSESVFGIEFK